LKVHQTVPIQFATTEVDFWIDFAIEFQLSLPYTLEEKGETFMGV
jgi:hypothetical protein